MEQKHLQLDGGNLSHLKRPLKKVTLQAYQSMLKNHVNYLVRQKHQLYEMQIPHQQLAKPL